MSKTSVEKIPTQSYTGEAIEPELTVQYQGTTLVKGTDYTVTYQNNVSIGTATAIITGINSYSGTKKVTFKIAGTPISKAKITGITNQVYTGQALKQPGLEIKDLDGNPLAEGTDYTLTYSKNITVGTATLQIKGIGKYTGTVKKTFKITQYDIFADKEDVFSYTLENDNVVYEKGGTCIKPIVKYKNKILTLGKDYTLSYKNNKSTSELSGKNAIVIIKGKGNFKGTVQAPYTIYTSNFAEGRITISAADKKYSPKKDGYKVEPVLTDLNGKRLTKGTDYAKTYEYYLVDENGNENTIDKNSVLPVGSHIRIYVQGIKNYEGRLATEYYITSASFGNLKFKIEPQIYTGKTIYLNADDITIKDGTTRLTVDDYEIVSYKNNVAVGNATVVLRGKGNYGGTKTVTFKIKRNSILWWWR